MLLCLPILAKSVLPCPWITVAVEASEDGESVVLYEVEERIREDTKQDSAHIRVDRSDDFRVIAN